jgi:hypothetical protein
MADYYSDESFYRMKKLSEDYAIIKQFFRKNKAEIKDNYIRNNY